MQICVSRCTGVEIHKTFNKSSRIWFVSDHGWLFQEEEQRLRRKQVAVEERAAEKHRQRQIDLASLEHEAKKNVHKDLANKRKKLLEKEVGQYQQKILKKKKGIFFLFLPGDGQIKLFRRFFNLFLLLTYGSFPNSLHKLELSCHQPMLINKREREREREREESEPENKCGQPRGFGDFKFQRTGFRLSKKRAP